MKKISIEQMAFLMGALCLAFAVGKYWGDIS
jgi:hypothetical protein